MILLTTAVQKKSLKVVLSVFFSVVLFVLVLLQCLEFYNFSVQEETFNEAFYMSMVDTALIKEQLPYQIKILVYGLTYIGLFVVAFIILAGKIKTDLRKPVFALASILLVVGVSFAIFHETCPGNFVKMFVDINKSRNIDWDSSSHDSIDYNYFEKMGISVCDVGHENLVVNSKGIQKNLVFIILESLEANFLDENLFPGLTPNLNRYYKANNSIVFSK